MRSSSYTPAGRRSLPEPPPTAPTHSPTLPSSPRAQVVVKGAGLDPQAVKAAVAKSGKATELWQ